MPELSAEVNATCLGSDGIRDTLDAPRYRVLILQWGRQHGRRNRRRFVDDFLQESGLRQAHQGQRVLSGSERYSNGVRSAS